MQPTLGAGQPASAKLAGNRDSVTSMHQIQQDPSWPPTCRRLSDALPLAMMVEQPCCAAIQAACILAVMPPRPPLLLEPNLTRSSWIPGQYVCINLQPRHCRCWFLQHAAPAACVVPLLASAAHRPQGLQLHAKLSFSEL